MFSDAVARRYSAALFALAQEAGQVDRVVAEIDAVVQSLHRDAELREFFASPVVSRDVKIATLTEALSGKVGELTLNFLLLLVRKRREIILEIVARQLHDLRDQAAGRERLEIETPSMLPAQELAAVARRLSGVYRRELIPNQKVSPGLLGGIVIQVGDKYVDASIAGRLQEIRRQLLAAGDRLGTAPISPDGHKDAS